VNVSFLVLLRGGDDALGILDAAFSLLTLFLCSIVLIIFQVSCVKKKSFRWSICISPSLSLFLCLSLPLLLFSTVVKECHKLSPVIGFIETLPSLCLLVDLISFLHFFPFFSFVTRRCASLPSAVFVDSLRDLTAFWRSSICILFVGVLIGTSEAIGGRFTLRSKDLFV
jgi:hypothetical protein